MMSCLAPHGRRNLTGTSSNSSVPRHVDGLESPMASIDCRGGDTVAVLLHGFLGDRRDVAPLQRVLASRLPCVSIDLPGHGDTPRLGQQAGGALEAVEASLEELCSRGCKRVVVIGYSMGGRLALQLASRLKKPRVAAIVLLSANPGVEDRGKREERAERDERLASRLSSMTPAGFTEWLCDGWYKAPLWGELERDSPRIFADMIRRRTDGANVEELAKALSAESVGLQPPLWEWLRAPPVPVLYAAGALDPSYEPLARRLEVGPVRVEVVDGAAHALLLEAPARVGEMCLAFAAAHSLVPTIGAGVEGRASGAVHLVGTPRVVPFEVKLTKPLELSRGKALASRAGCLLLLSGKHEAEGGGGSSSCGASVACHGIGEVCPLANFHAESLEMAEEQLRQVSGLLKGKRVPFELGYLGGAMGAWLSLVLPMELHPSVRYAVECALLHLIARVDSNTNDAAAGPLAVGGIASLLSRRRRVPMQTHVRINGLLTRDEAAACAAGASNAAKGQGDGLCRMRTWKLKVGGGDVGEEGSRLGGLIARFEALGMRLRLDANQAWDAKAAAAFFESARRAYAAAKAEGGVGGGEAARGGKRPRGEAVAAAWPAACLDYIEEPLAKPSALIEWHAASGGVCFGLDESVTPVAAELIAAWRVMARTDGGTTNKGASSSSAAAPPGEGRSIVELRERLGSPGCAALVLKPSLLGGIEVCAALAEEAAAVGVPAILTSAFESGVGHAHLAIAAAVLGGPSSAHGLSTYDRLQTDVLSPPFAQAIIGGDLVDVSLAQAALDATADALAAGGSI